MQSPPLTAVTCPVAAPGATQVRAEPSLRVVLKGMRASKARRVLTGVLSVLKGMRASKARWVLTGVLSVLKGMGASLARRVLTGVLSVLKGSGPATRVSPAAALSLITEAA